MWKYMFENKGLGEDILTYEGWGNRSIQNNT
jgi:hypothetical protein